MRFGVRWDQALRNLEASHVAAKRRFAKESRKEAPKEASEEARNEAPVRKVLRTPRKVY